MTRATVYFDEGLHRALKLRALENDTTISDVVNEAVRSTLEEDLEDLTDLQARKKEKPVSYESFLKELKRRGQI
jgi:predicted AAA+ superfamily ATPase